MEKKRSQQLNTHYEFQGITKHPLLNKYKKSLILRCILFANTNSIHPTCIRVFIYLFILFGFFYFGFPDATLKQYHKHVFIIAYSKVKFINFYRIDSQPLFHKQYVRKICTQNMHHQYKHYITYTI